MAHRKGVDAVDRALRDIKQNDRPMGGITVLFCGDFKSSQIMSAVPVQFPDRILRGRSRRQKLVF